MRRTANARGRAGRQALCAAPLRRLQRRTGDGVPVQEPSPEPNIAPAKRAEAIMEALKERTNLTIMHGGNRACYVPSNDTVPLPDRGDFRALPGTSEKDAAASKAFAYFSVPMHECCHSSMAKHCP
jgi:antirestriction protein ArdC